MAVLDLVNGNIDAVIQDEPASRQMMAARAIGMTKFQAIFNIILSQALRLVIPSRSNELIYTLKYSSVAYIYLVIVSFLS